MITGLTNALPRPWESSAKPGPRSPVPVPDARPAKPPVPPASPDLRGSGVGGTAARGKPPVAPVALDLGAGLTPVAPSPGGVARAYAKAAVS